MDKSRLEYKINMSKLVNFDFDDDAVSGAAVLARRAVLWPLSKALGTTHPDPVLAAKLVLFNWRALVKNLSGLGPSGFVDYKGQMLHSNCYPSMVCSKTRPLSMVCRYVCCPWCHGRRAQKLAEKAGFNDSTLFGALTYDMICFLAEHRTSVLAFDASSEASIEGLRAHLDTEATVCRALVRANKGLKAAFWQVTCDPAQTPAGDPCWDVCARMFGLRQPDKVILPRPQNWHFWDLSVNTPEKVGAALARAASYPTGLLTGDPTLASAALTARLGLRLFEFSGYFRGADSYKSAQGLRTCDRGESNGAASAVVTPG